MSMAITIKEKGMKEALYKLNKMNDIKPFIQATKDTALYAERMIKEVTPKGKKGHYTKDGSFVSAGAGIKAGGTARKGWRIVSMSTRAIGYAVVNRVRYVQHIFYAFKRTSDVVNRRYLRPRRTLRRVFELMKGKIQSYYHARLIKRYEDAIK